MRDIFPFFKNEAGFNCKRHYSLVFRKNVHQFLQRLGEFAELYVCTDSLEPYAEKVIQELSAPSLLGKDLIQRDRVYILN